MRNRCREESRDIQSVRSNEEPAHVIQTLGRSHRNDMRSYDWEPALLKKPMTAYNFRTTI
jgi:hypothetical protein